MKTQTYNIFILILIPFFFFVFILISPQKADAQMVPVQDLVTETATQATQAFTGTLVQKESFSDYVAYAAQQYILQRLRQEVVNRILGSVNSFVRNLGGELRGIQQKVSNQLGLEILGIGSCNFFPNFQSSLSNSLRLSNRNNYRNKFSARIGCPLNNAGAFFNNFSQGGWNSWGNMLRNPAASTPLGVRLSAQSELTKRQQEKEKRTLSELEQGGGYKPVKDANGNTKLPGKSVQEMFNETFKSQFRSMENADELSEAAASFIVYYAASYLDGKF